MAGVLFMIHLVVSLNPCVAVVYDRFGCVLLLFAFGLRFWTGLGFLVVFHFEKL